MAAKLLHSLADDNPDLQKQIGCMTGIFQLFDRQHMISGRRIVQKRLPPPPGSSQFSNIGFEREFNGIYNRQTPDDISLYKSVNEKQRVSTESSRASFSSSCSSSLSSLECSRTTQPEASSFDRIIFPETPSRDPTISQSSTSPHLSRQSMDLKDVVKDSMYRESRGLSLKTASREDSVGIPLKHRDSPRPVDLKESLRVLAKLQEAPWYYNEYETKDGSVSRDGRRFSYDGREVSRLSFESRETIKSAPKLRELPRLSLDSRQSTGLGSSSTLKANQLVDNSSSLSSGNFDAEVQNVRQSQKRPPSVVAKLMGLEALPDSASSNETHPEEGDSFTRQLKTKELMLPIRGFKSGRGTMREPTSPRWKNHDGVMKPVSRSPNEPAPWKQMDGNRNFQKAAAPKPVKATPKPSNHSVYGEIEKRLKDLEFKQSGKDLRALKQILEAIQSKGLLETHKEEQPSNFATQRNTRLDIQKTAESSNRFESPIVIMKPAKLVDRYDLRSSSVVAIDALSNLQKFQENNNNGSSNGKTAKNQPPRNSCNDKKSSGRNMRSTTTQASPKPQQLPKQSSSNSLKNSGSVSPRLQQKKLELEKRSRPPTPPSDSSKPRRQSTRHQTSESSSPGGKLRPKLSISRPSDDQLSEVGNEFKPLSFQGDDVSVHSDSNNVSDLKIDGELTSIEQPVEDSTLRLAEDEQLSELAIGAAEHRSPVSVLDISEYTDDALSPVKQESNSLADATTQNCAGERWDPPEGLPMDIPSTGITSEISRRKLQNVNQLVQKLRRLNSTHDEERTDYIASLCENYTNPDHRYISEILLASGLLLRDLNSNSMPFHLHPSGHPINPELFFVLEQTKASSKPKQEKIQRRLIFDAVNEILVTKLNSAGIISEPRVRPEKVARKTLTAQKLLKELCFEIEQLEERKKRPNDGLAEEDDSLKVVLWEDVMNRSGSWTDFHAEASGIVLDIERSIFKDLVNEVLIGVSGGLRPRPRPSRRRQLFAK